MRPSALAANARAMNGVFDTLNRAGIADKNIQTSNFSVSPQYANPKPGGTQRIIGYQVSNTVTVMVGQARQGRADSTRWSPPAVTRLTIRTFLIADPKPLLAKAREQAVKMSSAGQRCRWRPGSAPAGSSIREGGTGRLPATTHWAWADDHRPPKCDANLREEGFASVSDHLQITRRSDAFPFEEMVPRPGLPVPQLSEHERPIFEGARRSARMAP